MESIANMQYMPGDPRLVDQIVYELKSKGIFDQFRKECISDVDTKPAYQNLRQRVESAVSGFLSRQIWKPDMNKNQVRDKLRKHILDGNYLEQGVERIVDQVVNPKVASIFIPQVEDLVYNYFGITRRKTVPNAETSNDKPQGDTADLLPTDLEAVSPGSVKSHNDDPMDGTGEIECTNIPIETIEINDDSSPSFEPIESLDKIELPQDTQISGISELTIHDNDTIDKNSIPLPAEEINVENIPPPTYSIAEINLENIELPKALTEPDMAKDIPLPDDLPPKETEEDDYNFKPVYTDEDDDDDSSSNSSLRRNMSPITPIRSFDNENSCDAQQGFENFASPESKVDDQKEPTPPVNRFRFTIEAKDSESSSSKGNEDKKDSEQSSYKASNPITTYSTPLLHSYDDTSSSNNLHIDYESDGNSNSKIPETDQNSENVTEFKTKDTKPDEKKSSHKSSHSSRDRHRDSSHSKDKRSDSKHSSSKDRKDSKTDRKSSRDDGSKSKSNHKESYKDTPEKKDSRDSSKHRHSSSHKSSSSHKDSKSHRSSSSSHRHSSSSSKQSDDKKTTSSHKEKSEKSSESKSSKDHKSSSRHSSSHRSDKDRKSSSSKSKETDDKEKHKKDKKPVDDHYSLSGRGNNHRRSTDRDSNDGNSSSSKGSNINSSSKTADSKRENKSSSKSVNTSSSSETTSQSDAVEVIQNKATTIGKGKELPLGKPVVRVDLETPVCEVSHLPFKPEISIKKPKFAANFDEARQLMKMRRYLEDEERRKNQEAALLLEFQQNVRPNLSQVYSSIPGPELEFVCFNANPEPKRLENVEVHVENDVEYVMENASNEAIEENNANNFNDQQIQDNSQETEQQIQENNDQQIQENYSQETVQMCDIESAMQELHGKDGELSEQDVQNMEVQDNDECVESNNLSDLFVVTVITEPLSDDDTIERMLTDKNSANDDEKISKEDEDNSENNAKSDLKYFSTNEIHEAELYKDKYSTFLKEINIKNKLYLINCDSYEENIFKEISEKFGNFEIVNYYKNGHLKLENKTNNDTKGIDSKEIILPIKEENADGINKVSPNSPILSPIKSDCSFNSNDDNARIEIIMKEKSRKEIMEIILGELTDDSPSKMPQIGICNDYSIAVDDGNGEGIKRKLSFNEIDNNNKNILSPNKIRKLSESEQISSTTADTSGNLNGKLPNNVRSKYLGKARRVGLPKPKRSDTPNSPSSDKSVENYEQNAPVLPKTINGKIKTTPRINIQRYETTDLYKPKLHYLSRRNIT